MTFIVTPSAHKAGTSPNYDIEILDNYQNFTLSYLGEDGWGEVDGDIHDLQQNEDARREKALRELELRIVRFRNDEILRDLSTVVRNIRELVMK